MLDLFKRTLVAQFEAALSTLKASVVQCPDRRWEDRVGNFAFWHVAYHSLFFTDLYLSHDESSFEAPRFHREHYQFFGKLPWPPFETVVADIPYTKAILLDYVDMCRSKVSDMVASESAESFAGPSGFWWYKVPRAEMYLCNLRHVQHHAGQMSLCLRTAGEPGVDWVATGWSAEA